MNVVCKQWTDNFEIYGYHIEDILFLVKEAYAQRAKEGISFATLSYTLDDFLAERTDADYWFLAFDEDIHLYGTVRLTLKDNWGEMCNLAVLPQSQGKHVGSELLQAANQFAKEEGLDYIMSYTAMNAESSVRCHCKNGFQIIGISANLSRNYSSYAFRNQLSSSPFWNNKLAVKLRFIVSYIKYRIKKRINGSNTIIGNVLLYFKSNV